MPGSKHHIIVVGGSIAGLFAGVLLRRLGYEVDIYERAGEALASRGAGITTHDELYAAFAQAGISIERELAIESRGRALLDADGRVLGELAMPQLMTSWGLLYRFLRERFPDRHYHCGSSVSAVSQDGAAVQVELDDGRALRADYLIGADGMRSTVRDAVMPDAVIRYAGYTAWRGLADESALAPAVLEQLDGRFLLCLPPGEHLLGYMVAGPNDTVSIGQRCYNWVWYRPASADQRLVELLTGIDGEYYPQGIPHHLIQPRWIVQLRSDAERLVAPPLAAAIAATGQPFLQPIHELSSSRLVRGRVMLIGDAAFTARPHVGLGVSKAADDAAQLARVFAASGADFADRLHAWEQARLGFGQAAVRHSARLGCYLDGLPPDDARTQAEHDFFRRPEVVLARIAARNPYQFLD